MQRRDALTPRSKFLGERYVTLGHRGGLTWHAAHFDDADRMRMYRCTCMPSFRVGAEVHHPAQVRGRKAK